jgi:hypothetical protein
MDACVKLSREAQPVLVEMLLEKAADVNICQPRPSSKGKQVGMNFPLLSAAIRGSRGHRNTLALLRAGADANARDGFGMTALTHMVRLDNGTNLKVLLNDRDFPTTSEPGDMGWLRRKTLDVNAVDDGGLSPLMHALELSGRLFAAQQRGGPQGGEVPDDAYIFRIAHALLRARAEVNALLPGMMKTPLMIAAKSGCAASVALLL